MLPGDTSGDGRLDFLDALVLANVVTALGPNTLPCTDTTALLDGNGDGAVDLPDVVHLLSYLFLEGPAHVLGRECVPLEGCVEVCP